MPHTASHHPSKESNHSLLHALCGHQKLHLAPSLPPYFEREYHVHELALD